MKHGLLNQMKLLMLLLGLSANQAWAGAYANEDLAASAAGVANAVVASADDISAAIYNPAGLAWQSGVHALIGNHSRYRTLTVNQGGVSSAGDANLTDLSAFALAWKPNGSDWGASFSLATPFATRTDWNGTFSTPSASLSEMNLDVQRYAVDGFWRISNGLAVSLGTDWYDASMVMQSNGQSFSGSEQGGIAVHAGLRWEIQPFWTIGATYRQASQLNLLDGASSLDLKLPEELAVAVMHDVFDQVRLELDIKHTFWSATTDFNVITNNITTQALPINLTDSTDVLFGATWFWRDDTQLRFGYGFESSANQNIGFQPAIADLSGHRISLGFGGMMSEMHLDVAWSTVFYTDKAASGTWAGTYSDSRSSLMFTLSKSF